MLAVIVNTIAVIVGSVVGMLLKKGIPDNIKDAVMKGIGLCTIYIGISGALKGENTLILIISIALGVVIGELCNLDDKLNHFAEGLEAKFRKPGDKISIAEGFVTASLLFCVGAMTIVGSLNAGLSGDNELLITKSVLDLISSCMLSCTLGVGVMFSAVFVLLYQGGLVLLSGFLQTLLTDTALVAEITSAGSVMIIGLGLNILGITKIKVANLLPGILFVPLFYWLAGYLPL